MTCPDGSNAEVNVDATVVSWFDSIGRAVAFKVLVSLDEVPDEVIEKCTLSGNGRFVYFVTAVEELKLICTVFTLKIL